ncbi:MAG: SDR family oxidoreductase [Chloroflexaceae bacterium]|nr:SDR family oxidoreductase [Chloroflexaceae bacterium]NJL32704.1 SDR family oxidoreductase [Chloroflexaceae bacterium]NJO04983.1 SDR family oxidoreductase [Chloroflexaceae bacterium]
MQLSNKTAVVVGGGRGIGRAIALGFANAGANVVVAARSTDEIAETVWLIEETGHRARAITVDVRDSQQVEQFVEQTIKLLGAPQILVNSAGVARRVPALETSEETWDLLHTTLLKGTFLVTRAFLPHFIEQKGGNIINIGAPVDKLAIPGFSAYSAAKHAVHGLSLAWAKEFRRYSINVNVLHPGGFADTRLMREAAPEVDKGLIAPESVVDAAIYLAAQPPRGVTGEIIDTRKWEPPR